MTDPTDPAGGDLLPTPGTAPYWRRGAWPLWLALFMCILLFVKELPGLVPAFMGMEPPALGITSLLGLGLLLIAALGVAALAPGRLTAEHLGLTKPSLVPVAVVTVVALAAMYGVVYLGIAVSGTPNQDTSFGMGKDIVSDILLVVAIGAIGPVAEELTYRAVLVRSLSDGVARWLSPKMAGALAILVSSIIFSVAHTGAPPWHLAAYFVFGTVLAAGYWWTGSLYVAIIPHVLNNSYIAFTMAQKAQCSPVVLVLAALGPAFGIALAYGIGRLVGNKFAQ